MSAQTGHPEHTLDQLIPIAHRISEAINSVIVGKPETVRLAMTVLLAEGHALIEDVPGVGKTLMAKALARSIDCSVRRVQFTPDLLPSDITGVSAYNQELSEFELKPGPIFANLVLGDEINRDPADELAMLEAHGSHSPLDDLKPAAHASDVRALIAAVRGVHVAQQVRQYIIDLVNATRTASSLRLGASPRAALHLLRTSRAYAALEDRNFVIPDDVQVLALPVLAHRLLPTAEAVVGRELPEQVLDKIVQRLPLPGR